MTIINDHGYMDWWCSLLCAVTCVVMTSHMILMMMKVAFIIQKNGGSSGGSSGGVSTKEVAVVEIVELQFTEWRSVLDSSNRATGHGCW